MFIAFSEEFGIPVLWDACTQSVERHAQQLRHSQQWVEYPQAERHALEFSDLHLDEILSAHSYKSTQKIPMHDASGDD